MHCAKGERAQLTPPGAAAPPGPPHDGAMNGDITIAAPPPPPPSPLAACSGECADVNTFDCTGAVFQTGLCPGASSVKCCPTTTAFKQSPTPAPPAATVVAATATGKAQPTTAVDTAAAAPSDLCAIAINTQYPACLGTGAGVSHCKMNRDHTLMTHGCSLPTPAPPTSAPAPTYTAMGLGYCMTSDNRQPPHRCAGDMSPAACRVRLPPPVCEPRSAPRAPLAFAPKYRRVGPGGWWAAEPHARVLTTSTPTHLPAARSANRARCCYWHQATCSSLPACESYAAKGKLDPYSCTLQGLGMTATLYVKGFGNNGGCQFGGNTKFGNTKLVKANGDTSDNPRECYIKGEQPQGEALAAAGARAQKKSGVKRVCEWVGG